MKQLKDLKGSYHFANDIETIYGKENSIFFSASPLERSNMMRIELSISNPENHVEFIQGLRGKYSAIPMGGVYEDEGRLYVELNTVNIENSGVFEEIIKDITSQISKTDTNRDQITRETENLGMFRVGTKIRIVTDSSYQEEKEATSVYQTPSPIMAWFMAFVGMLGGVGIWYVFSLFRFISGIAGFFMIKWGLQLFRKYGGDLHRRNAIILLFMTFVMIVVAVMVPYIVLLLRNAPVTFIQAVQISWHYLFTQDGMINLMVGVGFSLLSSWSLVQGLLNNTPDHVGKRVKRKNNRLL